MSEGGEGGSGKSAGEEKKGPATWGERHCRLLRVQVGVAEFCERIIR